MFFYILNVPRISFYIFFLINILFSTLLHKILHELFVFIVAESPDTEAAMDLGASEVMESEILYDCVICGQSGPSTEDRPTGLVVLLQASSGNSFASNFIFQHEAPDLETKFAVSDHQWITYIITVFSDWTPSNF